jgi:hypothetical protein
VGDLHTALGHHLHEVAIRQPIGNVPSYAQLNDLGIEGALAITTGVFRSAAVDPALLGGYWLSWAKNRPQVNLIASRSRRTRMGLQLVTPKLGFPDNSLFQI